MHSNIVEAQFNSIKLTVLLHKKDFSSFNELVTNDVHGCGLHLMDDYLVKSIQEKNHVLYTFKTTEKYFKVQEAYTAYMNKFENYEKKAQRTNVDFNVGRISKHFPFAIKKDCRTLQDNYGTFHFDNVTIDKEPMVEIQVSKSFRSTEMLYVPLSSLVNLKTKYVSLYKFLERKQQEHLNSKQQNRHATNILRN